MNFHFSPLRETSSMLSKKFSLTIASTETSTMMTTTSRRSEEPTATNKSTTTTATGHKRTKRQRRRRPRQPLDTMDKRQHLNELVATRTITPISLLNYNNLFTFKKHINKSPMFMAIPIVMLILLQTTATILAQHSPPNALSSQDVSNRTATFSASSTTVAPRAGPQSSSTDNSNNNNNNQGDIKRHMTVASSNGEPLNSQQPAIEQVAKAEALTVAAGSSSQQNSAKLFEVCKSQSATNQRLSNLSQIVFQPSDMCSSWQKMLRSTATTTTSSDSIQTTINSDSNPWYYIEQLNLAENNLTVLHDSSGLGRLTNLLELKITHNQLSRCEEAALNGLQRLQTLDLSHNKLMALPAKFFQPVRHTIKELNLSCNSISVLVPTLFDSLSQLEILDLSNNDITSHWINDRLFRNLTQLRSLDLSFNKLSVFSSPATFSSLQQLDTLSLQHNELRQVPETIQHLRYLSSLDLSQNHIHDITNASYLSNCRSLFNLNLEGNILENITRDAFSDLPSLKVLNLANNRIHHLDQQAFVYVPDLHALRLDSNRLVDFGQAFVNLRFLLMLNISSNRISSFDYAQIPLGLQWLDLHSNKIDKLNNYYYTPGAQQQFSASNDIMNQQNSIGQQWQSMLRLTTLDVSHNLIRELDNTSLPESLETVQLNNNHIKTIASLTFSTKSNLTRINLSHNQLTTLPSDALKLNNNRDIIQPQLQQQKFVEIYLANNPFVCSCNNGWFSHLLLASTNPFPGGVIPTGNVRDQTFLSIYAQMTSRQLPRVADAQLVNCHLHFVRQTTHNQDPYTWSPVLAANQLALQHNHHPNSRHDQPLILRQLELLQSVHLCTYTHHCFALCNCCEFDACDCEMSCPESCSCYYDQKWNVNIVDCSAANQINRNPQARFTQMMMGVNGGGNSYHNNHHHYHLQSPGQKAAGSVAPQLVKFTNIPEKIPMDVTDLFLDGLELNQLRANALIGRKYLKTLYLNSSQLHSIENKALATQRALKVLQLNSNFLTDLFGFEFEQQAELRELYLANNRLRTIADATFTPLKSLQILHLQNNQLYHLNFWSNIPNSHKLNSINLGQNPWSCQCEYIGPMLNWLQANIKSVYDRKSVSCLHERATSLHLISPHATETSLVPMIYGSMSANNENYPMFTKDMCLNYTVPNQQPITDHNAGEPKPMEEIATGIPAFDTSTHSEYNDSPTPGSILNHPPNDEPPRILPPRDGYIEHPPDSQSRPPVSMINLSISLTMMMVIFIVVVMTLTHYRRRVGVWFYSNYGLNMFSSSSKPHKHPASNSIGKQHPHLSHQYGVGSSAGSTSSSSAASSNMSHALCQPQSTNGSTGLVTTPLIVSNSNQAMMNSASPYQDDDRLFDAYLTYSKFDEQFINDYIAPELECSPPSYRVALHYRDLPVTTNEFLTDCIIETANASRRVIMVVSEQLLRTEWMQYEFRSAHLEALKSNYRQRLIIIMLGQPSLMANLDPDLLQWLKSCTCIHWGEKMFWQRLRFAMPELSFGRQQNQHLRYQTLTSHQQQQQSNRQKATNQHSKGNNLGVNFLKSATGLLSGGCGGAPIPPPMGQQQLVTSSMHRSLGRPLPHPITETTASAANFSSKHQLQLQEEHHYAHLTPATMIQQHQTLGGGGGGGGGISSVGHAYHQPIYGDLSQHQQHQQQQPRDNNPVHI